MGRFSISLLALALSCGGAIAADDIDVIPAPNPERFGWTGVYLGASAGYGWLRDIDYAFVPPLRSSGEDWIFGAHAGYLHQFGGFVVGAEAEAQLLDIQFDGLPVWADQAYTIKARGGYAFDRFLITGHLGATWVTTRSAIPLYDGLADWALTYGAAVEYAVTDNLTLGVTYSRMTADRYDDTLIDAEVDTLNLRVGYRF